MFSLSRRKSIVGNDLLQSRLYDEKTFYKAFCKDLSGAQSSVIIESPYLTEKRALQLCRLFKKLHKRGVDIRINTRNPRHHDKLLEIQSWKAMKLLRQNGVKVYTSNDMRHRKIAIIDDHILWDGSLNILSQACSREVMRRTNSKDLCSQMASFTCLKKWYW